MRRAQRAPADRPGGQGKDNHDKHSELSRWISLAAGAAFALAVGGLSSGCAPAAKDGEFPVSAYENLQALYAVKTGIELEVAFEPGAEPYAGSFGGGPFLGYPHWDVVKTNLEALFSGRPRPVTVSVPHELSEMHALPAQNKALWTPRDAVALAERYRTRRSDAATSRFFVAFVNGYADNGSGGANPQVLAFQVSGTSVLVVFKQVVNSTHSAVPFTAQYVEQATVIHEMGHALGLVNHGVPQTTEHTDRDHGAHCSNRDCVMYWLIETGPGAAEFVERFAAGGSRILFADDCLNDARSYER